MTIKKKIITVSLIFLFLLVLGVTLIYFGLHQIIVAKNEAKAAHNLQTMFQEMHISFEKSLMTPHDYLILGELEDRETVFQNDLNELEGIKNQILELIAEEKNNKHGVAFKEAIEMAEIKFAKIEEDFPKFEKIAFDILKLDKPLEDLYAGGYMQSMDAMVRALEEHLNNEEEILKDLSEKALRNVDYLHKKGESILLIIGIFGLIFGTILAIHTIRVITRPIRNLLLATRKITAGDLTARADANTKDEIGELASSFNIMVRELIIAKERILNIFQGTGDSMRVIDQDFNILQVNKEMEKLTNIPASESVGKKCYDHFGGVFCHSDDCSLNRILRGEDLVATETVKKTAYGEGIPVELVATPLKREGEIIGVIESFRNITKRMEAESALKESELRLKTIVDSVQIGILIVDKETGCIFDANPTALKMLAASREQLVGVEYRRFLVEDSGDEGSGMDRDSSESVLIKVNGGSIPILRSQSHISLNGRDYLLESFIDITERKRVEEAIRQTEIAKSERQRVFSLLELLPAFVYLLAPDYSIPFANKQFREVFGDPKGKHCYEILHGLERPCDECLTFQVFRKNEMITREWMGANGRTYEFYDCPFTDIDGSPLALELGIDITQRKRAEDARREAERKLEEQRAKAILSDRLRSLGEMASGMAHELNQPLMGVRGLAEHISIGLDRGWNLSQPVIKDKIQLIIGQVDRMTHVIEHARTFARGADTDELMPVQVNDVIMSGMGLIGTQMRAKGIILEFDMSEDLPDVFANPFSLEEVFLNLINNAKDALLEQSKNGNEKPPPHIIIRTKRLKINKNNKEFVTVEIVDKGVGIPKKVLPRVFEPFYTTKDPERGTGLGLAISRSIIERFKGDIKIKTTVGKGTTVSVLLPVMTKAA